MANETIGSTGADRANIAAWFAAQGAAGTGTCILAEELDTTTIDLNVFYALTLTANSTAAVSAPSNSNASAQVHIRVSSGRAFRCQGGGGAVTWEKVGIFCTGSDAFTSENDATIRRTFIKTTAGGPIAIAGSGSTNAISNVACVAPSGTSCVYAFRGTTNIYHSSFLGGDGVYVPSSMTANSYATVFQGGGTGFSGPGTVGGDYNVSQDATAPGSSSTKYIRSESGWFANTGSGTEDLALHADKKGYWVAQSKDAIPDYSAYDCATDIVGTTRAAPIDPGCWQTPAAAGGQPFRKRWGGVPYSGAGSRGVW